MEINWFTVIAQIVNFLILVWLLRRFLYQPVLNAVDEREKKIASQLNDAERKKAEARKERDDFENKNIAFDREREAKMAEVQTAAQEEKHRLQEEVRQESQALRARYEEAMIRESESHAQMLKRKLQDEIFATARKALDDLADVSLEARIVHVFIEKMKGWDEAEKERFREAFAGEKSLEVITAFPLEESSKTKLENTIHQVAGKPVQVHYKLDPDIVSGIEIHSGKFQISWSIEAYLDHMKKDILDSMPRKQRDHAAI